MKKAAKKTAVKKAKKNWTKSKGLTISLVTSLSRRKAFQ